MPLLKCENEYLKFMGSCTQCGHCKCACSSLSSANMTLGDIAQEMLRAQATSTDASDLMFNILGNEALVQAVRGCFFCTSCKNTCFAHNDVCALIYAARVDFQNLGLIDRAAFSSVLVDQEWDIFTAYRAIHGIYFNDLTRHVPTASTEGSMAGQPAAGVSAAQTDCEVAFFPGCSLAAYGTALTREIFATIEGLSGKTTMIDHCCGSPLKSAGFYARAEALCEKIAQEIYASGAARVVCVCPGCANAMRAVLDNSRVKVQCLPEFLNEHNFKPKKPVPENLCFSKSCQDRDGSYLAALMNLLGVENSCDAATCAETGSVNCGSCAGGAESTTPIIFKGCCGAGGAVSAFQPERQAAQAEAKLSLAPAGSCVVTMCPTCTYTYASVLMQNPKDVQNKHYAELLFDNQFDWDMNFAQLNSMWSGEYGAWLAQVFA